MASYYTFLSGLSAALSGPLTDLSYAANIPLLTAVLLGLIGAASPCQLSTNVAALAYVSRRAGSPGRLVPSALAYVGGKVLVYTLLGVVAVSVGAGLERASIPVAVLIRKALGPLFVLMGLYFLGLLPLKLTLGSRLVEGWRQRVQSGGVRDSFALGVLLSFAFCPTLFWLFFGLLIPLSLSTLAGPFLPALFALGTAVPLLLFTGLLALGLGSAGGFLGGARRLDSIVRRVTGVVFVLVGINEIVLYWLA